MIIKSDVLLILQNMRENGESDLRQAIHAVQALEETWPAAGGVVPIPVQRDVLDHRVEGKGGGADDTRICVIDEPGQGGACHWYQVRAGSTVLLDVKFQNGPIQEFGVNGVQQEHLLSIVADRLRSFQAGPFGSRYNAIALTKTEEALMWLQRRTVDRIRRGVEGFNKA